LARTPSAGSAMWAIVPGWNSSVPCKTKGA
jgi:hypothetical protein